ncbi:MAG: NADH:ubiquinone reductase (Na(+)-transporting) subunit B [Thermodesulfobacteriota bacterium]
MIDKIFNMLKPHFEEGGRIRAAWPLYDALQTLFYRLPVRTVAGVHLRDAYDLKRMMMTVVIALVPCALFGTYNTGYHHFLSRGMTPEFLPSMVEGLKVLVPLLVVTYTVGLTIEVVFAIVRKHEVSEGFFVSGMLITLIMPPTIPLWQVALATAFAVVLGKEVFGGTGMNIFNPALMARAFIFFAYPRSLSGHDVWTLTTGTPVDAYTMATPLAVAHETAFGVAEHLAEKGYGVWKMFIGLHPGCIGETSELAILLGAILLIGTGVGSWRIILSVFAGGAATVFLFNAVAPSPVSIMALPLQYHLVMGSFAFGAVFMATDPVSAASTNGGKYVYGFFIGVLIILVRVINPAYEEGTMLAILFMNLFAPLIDYTVLRIHMRRRRSRAKAE